MSGNSLYDPDQAAVDTRWIQPWSEAFRVSIGCLSPPGVHGIDVRW